MIPDLRSRLKAAAERAKPAEAPKECMVLEGRTPLSEMPGLLEVGALHARRLGLDFPGFDVRRALFLDTETTGLRGAGTVAFLVGAGWVEEGAFVVRQYLMRDYPEEVSVLEGVAGLLEGAGSVVSFNGKSFDMPLLRDRFIMARMRDRWRDLPQLDLLHAARRTWKLRLGTCTLSALEAAELGIAREHDLPGAEVPERYFAFLKTRDFALLTDVLHHNAQDIRTLAVLMARLARAYEAPDTQVSMLDVYSIGRALEKCGEGEMARRCFTVASVSNLSQQARLELARSYRRDRAYAEAADTYSGMIARGEGGIDAYTALAVLLEWQLSDPRGALEVTDKALFRFSGNDLFTRPGPEAIASLMRRRERLKKKIGPR